MSEYNPTANPEAAPPPPPAYSNDPATVRSMPPAAFQDPRRKTPFLASLLSVMPGLGQVYVGYYQRGFVHALVVATLVAILAGAADQHSEALWPFIPLMAIFLGFFWLYNIVDAGRRAALYNQALAGGSEIEMPKDFQPLNIGGSIFGGLCIATVGFILLLNTRFGVSLDWVAQWWPAALMIFGGYLVYKVFEERKVKAANEEEL